MYTSRNGRLVGTAYVHADGDTPIGRKRGPAQQARWDVIVAVADRHFGITPSDGEPATPPKPTPSAKPHPKGKANLLPIKGERAPR